MSDTENQTSVTRTVTREAQGVQAWSRPSASPTPTSFAHQQTAPSPQPAAVEPRQDLATPGVAKSTLAEEAPRFDLDAARREVLAGRDEAHQVQLAIEKLAQKREKKLVAADRLELDIVKEELRLAKLPSTIGARA